jgi:hypothetical protein
LKGENDFINVDNRAKKDSGIIVKRVYGFMKWYKINYKQTNSFPLTYTDGSNNYQVSLTNCDKYLSHLKSSKFISQEYIRLWREYFQSKAENFKTNVQNEGPPEGFDFDFVLHSQEPELIFQSLEKLRYTMDEMSNTKAVITVHSEWEDWKYSVELSKINKIWYIDYISLKEPD